MQVVKMLAVMALGGGMLIAAHSGALAKAHDQGVADGTRIDPSNLRGGVVAGVGVDGVGPAGSSTCLDPNAAFCGVAADLENDLNYGQDIVQNQVATDTRRVKPVDRPGLNKPPLAD